jgi:predicted ATP-grasp superfamily ATP-dependent carboligase
MAYPELRALGSIFFKESHYRGVGSAEFKLDERDGKLKLIELNPRYWQQNALATACGMNFPLVDYLEATGQGPKIQQEHVAGIKWVNRYMDLDSFLIYRKEGALTFSAWRKTLKGKKVYSDFSWADPVPGLYEIGFGLKLVKAPWFIWKRLIK